MYEEIYKDMSDWLKFIEAKILAVLTIQVGFLYFIYKIETLKYERVVLFIGVLCSLLLLISIMPKINKNNSNPYYFGAWGKLKSIEDIDSGIDRDSCLFKQCNDLGLVIRRKIVFLKVCFILLCSEFLLLILPGINYILTTISK